MTPRRFVVVSGIPGSGKTTLARRLAPALGLEVIDKDDILERLFETRGIGDHARRRSLSRESDLLFRAQAEASNGAVLVSFWHQPGMAADSGTPTDWLAGLMAELVTVHCACPPEVAAARFVKRTRHEGHLDAGSSYEDILMQLTGLASLPPLDFGRRIEVDTSGSLDIDRIVQRLSS